MRAKPLYVLRRDDWSYFICRPIPWLNPIERLWRQFRREVTHCELFETVKTLLAASCDFFDRCNQCCNKVLSIIQTHPSFLLCLYLGRVSPFPNIFATSVLKPMLDDEWKKLVRDAFSRTGQTVSATQLALVGELSGGHPYLAQMAGYYVWDMKSKPWDEAEPMIRDEFRQQARGYFKDLWLRLNPDHKNVVRSILKLATDQPVRNKHLHYLKDRGLVVPSGDALFCKAFADYLLDELA
jgi:hypothetical protein